LVLKDRMLNANTVQRKGVQMDSNRKKVSADKYSGIQACGSLETLEWCGLLIERNGVKYF